MGSAIQLRIGHDAPGDNTHLINAVTEQVDYFSPGSGRSFLRFAPFRLQFLVKQPRFAAADI